MGPAKFDDLSKTAKDVLSEDYPTTDINFKSKQATNFEGWSDLSSIFTGGDGGKKAGATLTTAIDLNLGSDKCATPAKLTWKFPKPLGLAGLAFDKLEMDKGGKMKLEASVDKGLHGVADLKIECKSDLKSPDGVSVGATYTGIADALCKAETKLTNPGDFTAEASYAVGGGATVAVKASAAGTADVAVQYVNGPMFCSVVSGGMFSAFNLHGYYKACDELKVAANYQYGGKSDGQFSAGLAYALMPDLNLKGKLTGVNAGNLAVSASAKKELSKGVTVTAGGNYPLDGNKGFSWGMQFNVE